VIDIGVMKDLSGLAKAITYSTYDKSIVSGTLSIIV
jgi:hypothetical protein